MNFRSTLMAAVLLAGLGSWYYFYEHKGKEARDKAKEDAKLVFKGFDGAAVNELRLRKDKASTVLKKIDGAWRLTEPLQAAADGDAVERIFDAVKNLKNEEVIDEKGAAAADFGIGAASATASFLTGPGTAKTLRFGMDNPTGQYVYAQVEGEAPVFMIMSFSKNNVLKDAKELRDKKFWDFQIGSVSKVKSSLGKGLALEGGDKGAWKITRPISEQGHQENIENWLRQLAGLRIDEFAENPGKLGSVAGRFELVVGGQEKPLVLLQGAKAGDNKGRWYKIEGKAQVFSLAEHASGILDKKADELADTEAFAFKSFEVERFEIERAGKVLKANKKEGNWSWDPSPAKKEGEAEFDFFSFLSQVSTAKLKARLSKETKIASPSMTLIFFGQKDAILEKITLGAKGRQGSIALSQSKSHAVEVAEDLFSKLPQ